MALLSVRRQHGQGCALAWPWPRSRDEAIALRDEILATKLLLFRDRPCSQPDFLRAIKTENEVLATQRVFEKVLNPREQRHGTASFNRGMSLH